MGDLGEVRTGGGWRRLFRLAVALGTVLAGLLAITAGGARLVTDLLVGTGLPVLAARQIGIATVSTLPPVILAAALVLTNENSRARLVGLAGVAIAFSGIAVGLPLGFRSAAVLIVPIYVTGLFFIIASLGHGFLEPSASTATTAGWTRERSGSVGTPDAMPADGGEEEDDELDFLLESEDDFQD